MNDREIKADMRLESPCRYCRNVTVYPLQDGEYVALCQKAMKAACLDFEWQSMPASKDSGVFGSRKK